MKNFTLTGKASPCLLFSVCFFLSHLTAISQRNFQLIYSDNIAGDFDIIGNTVMGDYTGTATNPVFGADIHLNTTGNDSRTMRYIDMDGTTGNGAATRNSSMAKLNLPAGSTVVFAKLVWGGRANKTGVGSFDMNLPSNQTVKFRKGNGAYSDVQATEFDYIDRGGFYAYQCSAPVTIIGDPNGEYWAGNIAVTPGNLASSGAFGGWFLYIVYTNPSLPVKSVRAYDGFQWVFDEEVSYHTTVTLSGLAIPAGAGSEARMGAVVWEGDGNLAGDSVKINGNLYFDDLNPVYNTWNGTISTNGAVLPPDSRLPYLGNQMSIDIDQFDISSYIPSGAFSVTFDLYTERDSYYPSLFAFSANMTPPVISLDKTATTSLAPFDLLNPNELITYTLSGSNTGSRTLTNSYITDTIPFGLTYEPGTLIINTNAPGGPTGLQSDEEDEDQAYKGTVGTKEYVKFYIGRDAAYTLQPGDSYSVQFQCRTPANANPTLSVYNTARIHGTFDGVEYTDDGTAIIGPQGVVLSVNLSQFKVSSEGNQALLSWATAGELKNDRFDIERSIDGISFTKIGTVRGNGTTNDEKQYRYTDALVANASIVYYRLSIVDIDGIITYSKIIALRLNGLASLTNFMVYPNPFVSSVKMQINSTRLSKMTVRISNAAGLVENTRIITLQPGENIVVLEDLEKLQPGAHFLELITEEGKMTQKIIKK